MGWVDNKSLLLVVAATTLRRGAKFTHLSGRLLSLNLRQTDKNNEKKTVSNFLEYRKFGDFITVLLCLKYLCFYKNNSGDTFSKVPRTIAVCTQQFDFLLKSNSFLCVGSSVFTRISHTGLLIENKPITSSRFGNRCKEKTQFSFRSSHWRDVSCKTPVDQASIHSGARSRLR